MYLLPVNIHVNVYINVLMVFKIVRSIILYEFLNPSRLIYLNEHEYWYEGDDLEEPESKSEISSDLPFSTIRVNIEDTGIGLSKDARENLFLPFKQVCSYIHV